MSKNAEEVLEQTGKPRPASSVDGWAVTLAFVLALLVRAGLLKHIPW